MIKLMGRVQGNMLKDSVEMTFKLRPAGCVAIVPAEDDSPEHGPAWQVGWGRLRRTDRNPNFPSTVSPWEMVLSLGEGGKPEWSKRFRR